MDLQAVSDDKAASDLGWRVFVDILSTFSDLAMQMSMKRRGSGLRERTTGMVA